MIAIPSHPCLPCDPAREAPMTYGELDRDNVATCSLRVRWGTGERAPGCGARIALCHGCGLRTRVNGAPCGACGGTERPTQVLTAEPARASNSDVDQARSIVEPAPMSESVSSGKTHVQRVDCGPKTEDERVPDGGARSPESVAEVGPVHARADVSGQGGDWSRRETKAKAPSKPRAPTKRVAKGKAAPDGPELPFMK